MNKKEFYNKIRNIFITKQKKENINIYVAKVGQYTALMEIDGIFNVSSSRINKKILGIKIDNEIIDINTNEKYMILNRDNRGNLSKKDADYILNNFDIDYILEYKETKKFNDNEIIQDKVKKYVKR